MSKENVQAFMDEVGAIREKYDVDLFCIAGDGDNFQGLMHGKVTPLGVAVTSVVCDDKHVKAFYLTVADAIREMEE